LVRLLVLAAERHRIPSRLVRLLVLAAATLALRLPFLAPRLAHWDAVNYALGLHDFNVAAHQPHPPGSPYFILLGRVFLWLTGDDNAALLGVTLLASVGAVLAEYALVRLLFGPRAALLAAILLMTQPVFWGYGTMATAWTVLACLAIVAATLCLLLARGRMHLLFPSAIFLGFASGFRLDVTVFFAPLWLWTVYKAEPRWWRRIATLVVVGVCVLLWLVPVVASAGGPEAWALRLLALLPPDTPPAARARQLATNTATAFGTLGFTIGPALVVALLLDARGTISWLRSTLNAFWILWIVPPFVFLWLVDSTEPGHDLIFVPALVALGSGLIVRLASTARRLVVAAAALLGAQSAVFLAAAPISGIPLASTADSALLNLTASGIRQQQTSLDWTVRTIRERYDPRQTVVVTVVPEDPYRFMMYYLPEFVVLRLDPPNGTVLSAQNKREGNWIDVSNCVFANFMDPQIAGKQHAVWVISSATGAEPIPEGGEQLPGPGTDHALWSIWDVRSAFTLGPADCGQ
jgi:hypothetical protein